MDPRNFLSRFLESGVESFKTHCEDGSAVAARTRRGGQQTAKDFVRQTVFGRLFDGRPTVNGGRPATPASADTDV